MAKLLVYGASGRSLKEQMAKEQQTFIDVTRTVDFVEGVDAFIDKRAPTFVGQ